MNNVKVLIADKEEAREYNYASDVKNEKAPQKQKKACQAFFNRHWRTHIQYYQEIIRGAGNTG
jgi:hypothetical protein